MKDNHNNPGRKISLATYIGLQVELSKSNPLYRSPYLLYGHVPDHVYLPDDLELARRNKMLPSNISNRNPFSQKFQIIYQNNGFYTFVKTEE